MSRVDSDTVILGWSTFSYESPISILFTKIQSGGIGDEKFRDDPSGETEPAHYPESSSGVNVVVQDGRDEGS
jgi:hypothetical protein